MICSFKVGNIGFATGINFVIKRSKKNIRTLANSFEECIVLYYFDHVKEPYKGDVCKR